MTQGGRDDTSIHGFFADSEELLVLAQEAGRLGLFEWHVQTGRVRLSPAFLDLYGIADFDGRYETWLKCIYREDLPHFTHALETAFAVQERNFRAEFRILRPLDGLVKWIEVRRAITYDEAGLPLKVVGVSVDITERKRAIIELRAFADTLEDRVRERTRALEAENEARQKAEEALRQAQKMDAVGQLTGGVAHDFNNLLTIIQGGVEMIGRQLPQLEGHPSAARVKRGRELALEGVRRAATLTQRLLAFSRQQPLAPQVVDINKLIAGISDLLRRTLGETISLESVLAGGIWRTFVDENQLENALLNLAINARDAMPAGGKLTIEAANCYLDEAYVAAAVEPVKAGQYVLLAVTDNGEGIDKAILDRVFEPFFTTKGVGKGTGLGLSQVYGFVRQSSGHIKIYSENREGTTVKIYLPRHTGALDIEAGSARTARAAVHQGTETILVVEDDEQLRAYSCDVLAELGYRVIAAENGAAALDALKREPSIDLLFTDIVMPGGMNGRQLADAATSLYPHLKVLFTTGYTRNAIVHHGRLDPGVELITKPFSFDDVAKRIRAVLDRA